MTRTVAHGWRQRLLVGLCWAISLQFFVFAPFKFYPGGVLNWPSYPDKFVNWGYPAWFSYVVGAGEIFAAVTLLLPRRRFLGAGVLVITMVGAIVTHVINDDPFTDFIAAPVQLVSAGIVALAYWPADWREPLAFGQRSKESRAARRSTHDVTDVAARHP
jgi:uncharacterized membrane protein YphA (DoxX/SURF4 family)